MSGQTQEGFFKIRQTKRSNPEERTTLDVIHQFQLKKISEEKQEAADLATDIAELTQQIETTQDDFLRGQLETHLTKLKEEYELKHNGDRMYDYLLETGDILFQYYELQDKISKGTVVGVTQKPKRKPGDVLSALQSAHALETGTEECPATEKPKSKKGSKSSQPVNRDMLLEQYLLKINPEYTKKINELDDMSGECQECGADMMFSQNEAMLYCPDCGTTEFMLIDSDRPSYKDPPRESSYYAYKRINHEPPIFLRMSLRVLWQS
jgi:hypothetical protein